MPINITLPALSAGMEDAVIARWLKAEGEMVGKGDLIAEVETDKATMELEAEASGRIGRILVPDGTRATVGQLIAVLLAEGEATAAAVPVEAPPAAPVKQVAAVVDKPAEAKAQRIKASPLARRMAAESGVNLETLTGSGPAGRIVRIDVQRAAEAAAVVPDVVVAPQTMTAPETNKSVPPGIGPYTAIPHSSMRRTIARRLLEAKTTVPHFYLNTECDIDELLLLRTRINETRDKSERISVNDFVVKASAVALRAVPEANAVWTEDAILRLADIDIAVAVATDGGLITPVIRQADRKSLSTTSADIKVLAARARENRLKPEEYQGGGFSVSNLGMYGVTSFSAIINPPQSAILAVGAGKRRPVEKDGALAFATIMECTLSVDHRSVDGALGARLLAAFKAAIENPMSILV